MIMVYVTGLRGPVPEKWPVILRDMNGKPKPYLALHTLTPEQAKLSLDELMVIFPPPKVDVSE